MKNYIYILLFSIILSSCQDVIELDVASKASKLVVDGWIDSDSVPKIYLYKSQPYFESKEYPKVTGAIVTLNDGSNSVNLNESIAGSGFYTTNVMKGIVDKTYTLTIQYENKTYTSVSTMPKTIAQFDSIYFRPLPFGQPGQAPRIVTNFAYQEYPEKGNCYMARFSRNGVMDLKNLNFTDDQFINGNHITDVFVGEEVFSGDTIRLEAYGITKEYFGFLNQIISNVYQQQGLFSPPLAPYKGNISNDALGFFRTSGMIAKDTIVP